MPRLIAVYRAGALGDILITLPAIRALRAAFPGARLRAVGYPQNWEVVGGLIDEIVPVDGPANRWFASADLVVSWASRSPITDAPVVHSEPHPPPGIHAADWLLASIRRLVATDPTDEPLFFSTEELEDAHTLLDKLGLRRPVVLHPSAGAKYKCWPGEKFASLAASLTADSYEVALLEGPADGQAVDEVLSRSPVPVIRSRSARRLGAVLSQCLAYVGNDSGPTHLSAAVHLPTLALFGPTDPSSWAPRPALVLRTCCERATYQGQIRVCPAPDCVAALPVSLVRATLKDLLEDHASTCGASSATHTFSTNRALIDVSTSS